MRLLTIWETPANWPRVPGYVFLAQAVQTLGAAMFADWTGLETTTIPTATPSRPNGLAIPASLTRRTSGHPATGVSDENWQKILAHVADKQVAERPAMERLHKVKASIQQAVVRGELAVSLRIASTGQMWLAQPFSWNVDNWGRRFVACEMNPAQPNSLAFAGVGFEKIFVSESDLAVICSRARPLVAEAERSAPASFTARQRARAAMAEVMKASPGERTHSNAELRVLADAAAGVTLSRDAFDHERAVAREDALATAWGKGGRPRNSPGGLENHPENGPGKPSAS